MTGVDPVDWLINIPDDHAMDCVIGHGVHLGRQIPLIQRSHQCKWIQIVHNAPESLAMYKRNADAIPRGEKMQQTETELCELADQVVAVGPKLADTYRRFLCSSKKHQDVIDLTPSIFTEFLDVMQATEERKTFCVLVVGSGDSEDFNLKGYDLAARAIAELKENSYQLKFVCAPRGKANEIAEKLLEHDIDHSQLIVCSFNESRETLARLFCEVDLAIMPSRSEGFGLTALEALSAGLPVLVSSNSGLGEALMKVPNGSNCVVDSEDPEHWASKIKAVREKDRDVRLAESDLLRKKYLEKYSWQAPCGVLVEKMQNLVTGSPGWMSGSVECSDLPPAVASQNPERHNYQREDTQRSFGHSGPPSFLKYCQSPFPAGPQTPAQTYQTSRPQSSSGHGRPPTSLEYNQSPFLIGPQTPAQMYHTSHPQSSFGHDKPPSLPEHKTGPQTPVQTYKTSHPWSEWKNLFLSLNSSKINVPLAGGLHQWNTVGFPLPCLVRLVEDQVIRNGTLQKQLNLFLVAMSTMFLSSNLLLIMPLQLMDHK
ncbi:uncharacterized protein LOC110049244 isoform X2 [Orbicella faveolata]|uniref:uncharacterized protein LOC110049244 isoform X2 n=1 Tax=Orbicella faveolata TaxID=48498 RepID=UPI0009E346DE|nr:uncharacterized protein LOC110049244 isoform X2 [Orbicella faveolata]